MMKFKMSQVRGWVAVSLVGASLAACGGGASSGTSTTAGTASSGDESHEAQAATPSANVVAPGIATIGDTSTCPVSGETFVVTASSPSVEYEGRTYYFCCPGCDARFRENPSQFLNAPAPAEGATAEPAS